MNESEYIIRYLSMPITVRAFTIIDSDGLYNIYLNDKLAFDDSEKAIKHEIEHIIRGDFFRYDPASIFDSPYSN